MGGNAIPKARRVPKEEYDAIIAHVVGTTYYVMRNDITEIHLGDRIGIRGEIVKSYHQKEDFGDIDVVIDDRVDIVDLFAHFRPKKCAVNGNVMSIAYDSIQIDFIRTPKEYIQTTLDYFAYNDLGNLLGKIARAVGLKYGNKGLIYQYKDDKGNVIEDIQVTAKLEEIIPALGLDYKRYEQGFDTMEDIFKFVASSLYFNPEMYALENATTANRIRDARRKTYQAFLDWIGKQTFYFNAVGWTAAAAERSYPSPYSLILNGYPHVAERIKVIETEREQEKLFRELINGAVIGDLTGLTGAELGQFIERFRQLHTKDEILKLTRPEVWKLITDTFEFFKQKAQEKENG